MILILIIITDNIKWKINMIYNQLVFIKNLLNFFLISYFSSMDLNLIINKEWIACLLMTIYIILKTFVLFFLIFSIFFPSSIFMIVIFILYYDGFVLQILFVTSWTISFLIIFIHVIFLFFLLFHDFYSVTDFSIT